MSEAIRTSLTLYAIWTLLPLAVAVVIFKLFPDTKVSASGPLQNLTINATGAFGAYLITLVAGWLLINRIDERIQLSVVTPTWELSARVKFVDTEGKEIKANNILREELRVYVEPPLVKTRELPHVYVLLPLVKPDEWPTLQFTAPGFIPEPFSPRQLIDSKKAKIKHPRIEFLEEVVLHQVPAAVPVSPASTAEKYLEPEPKGPAPVAAQTGEKVRP